MLRLPSAFWLLLGLAHACADAATGWLLFSEQPLAQALLLFVLYNGLAFVLQPALGAWLDRKQHYLQAVVGSLLLLALALLLKHHLPLWVVVLVAALASACFHAAAGAIALSGAAVLRQTAVFTAPGVLGLALGTAAALGHWQLQPGLSLGLALLSLGLLKCYPLNSPGKSKVPGPQTEPKWSEQPALLPQDLRDLLLLAVVLTIALRSFLWSAYQQVLAGKVEMLLLLGLGACCGKLLGGLLAHIWGPRVIVWSTVGLALPCLLWGSQQPLLLFFGVGALQMSVPYSLSLLARLLPEHRATAAGLGLGFALALGGLPFFLGWQGLPAMAWVGLALLMLAFSYRLLGRWLGLWRADQEQPQPAEGAWLEPM